MCKNKSLDRDIFQLDLSFIDQNAKALPKGQLVPKRAIGVE
ncbi:MAG: hypothetical protein QNJ54_00905 [Prochloraceae cyanobacterium]|nr:hypothetical protein [Prochloraceae cyanobacterium]